MELGMKFTADALEHSQVEEAEGEVRFLAPEEFAIAMKEADLQKAIRTFDSRPRKVKVTFGAGVGISQTSENAPPPSEDETSRRALSHPQVQRFQELFGGQVRQVRNLKE
jgi:hypothetical protein